MGPDGLGLAVSLLAAAEERRRRLSPEALARRQAQAADRAARDAGNGIGTFMMPVVLPKKPGRNTPCQCGSGKKTKKCHPEGR